MYSKNNITVEELEIWNGYSPKNLPIGQSILICNPLDVPDEYIDSFDTLIWEILEVSPTIERETVITDNSHLINQKRSPICDKDGWLIISEDWENNSIFSKDNVLGNSMNSFYNNVKRSQYIKKCEKTASNFLKKFDLNP